MFSRVAFVLYSSPEDARARLTAIRQKSSGLMHGGQKIYVDMDRGPDDRRRGWVQCELRRYLCGAHSADDISVDYGPGVVISSVMLHSSRVISKLTPANSLLPPLTWSSQLKATHASCAFNPFSAFPLPAWHWHNGRQSAPVRCLGDLPYSFAGPASQESGRERCHVQRDPILVESKSSARTSSGVTLANSISEFEADAQYLTVPSQTTHSDTTTRSTQTFSRSMTSCSTTTSTI